MIEIPERSRAQSLHLPVRFLATTVRSTSSYSYYFSWDLSCVSVSPHALQISLGDFYCSRSVRVNGYPTQYYLIISGNSDSYFEHFPSMESSSSLDFMVLLFPGPPSFHLRKWHPAAAQAVE